jgi:hypothetical protein
VTALPLIQRYYNYWAARGHRMRTLRCDGGGVYIAKATTDWAASVGVHIVTVTPRTPEQNAVPERFNRTVLDAVRAMLIGSNMPRSSWEDCMRYFVQIYNRRPHRTLGFLTPFEVSDGHVPSVAHFRTFGCIVWGHVPSEEKHDKLEDRARRGRLVGYDGVSYMCLLPSGAVRRCFNCVFDERMLSQRPLPQAPGPEDASEVGGEDGLRISDAGVPLPQLVAVPQSVEPAEDPEEAAPAEHDGASEEKGQGEGSTETLPAASFHPSAPLVRRSARTSVPIDRLGYNARMGVPDGVPDSWDEANMVAWEDNLRLGWANSANTETERLADFSLTAALANVRLSMTDLSGSMAADVPIHRGFAKSISDPVFGPYWKAAMDSEFESLTDKQVWDLVDPPAGARIFGGSWVNRAKPDDNGRVKALRSRWVFGGHRQVAGIDYQETFAPVCRTESLKVLLSVVAANDWDLMGADVKSAYLYGEVPEDEPPIYMRQPDGYAIPGAEHKVCRLKRMLYGTHQGGRTWNKKIHNTLVALGFVRSAADDCVYLLRRMEQGAWVLIVVLLLYVDDILVAGTSLGGECKASLDAIADVFDLVRTDAPTMMLGMQIERDRTNRTLKLHQNSYAHEVLERFEMSNCTHLATPADPSIILVARPASEPESTSPVLQAIGSLRYLADKTRPDLCYSLGVVSKFASKPGAAHWKAIKRILRYLKGTASMGLMFGGPNTDLVVRAWCDADFAADPADRRSVSGYLLMLGGGPVSWSSKKQKGTTALSTTEAEYLAMGAAVQDIIWHRRLLADLGEVQHHPTTLFVDNQAAISIAQSGSTGHNRQKHIDVKHHFVKGVIEDGSVALSYVQSADNLADPFTKALPRPGFVKLIMFFMA